MSVIGNMFGGSTSGGSGGLPGFRPQAIISPAYRIGYDPGSGVTSLSRGFGATYSNPPTGLTPPQLEFSRRFPRALGDIDTLRTQVRPGFSLMREAGLGSFAAAREREAGNLRESLARRNVLGSDFASDAFSRQAREFAQGEAEFLANVSLQELQTTQQLIDFERAFVGDALNRELAELGVAAGVSVSMNNIFTQNAAVQAQLAAAERMAAAQGAGSLLGTGAGLLAFGGGNNSIFSNGNLLSRTGLLANLWSSGGGGGGGGGYGFDASGGGFGSAAPF